MYHLIEAETWKGIRRFLIAADTGREAAQEMAALIDRGARLMDESGEWFQPFEIDPAEHGGPRRSAAAPHRRRGPLHERRAADGLTCPAVRKPVLNVFFKSRRQPKSSGEFSFQAVGGRMLSVMNSPSLRDRVSAFLVVVLGMVCSEARGQVTPAVTPQQAPDGLSSRSRQQFEHQRRARARRIGADRSVLDERLDDAPGVHGHGVGNHGPAGRHLHDRRRHGRLRNGRRRPDGGLQQRHGRLLPHDHLGRAARRALGRDVHREPLVQLRLQHLDDPHRRQLHRRADLEPVLLLRRVALSQRRHGRLRRRHLLPQQRGDARPDVRLPVEGRARPGLHPARVHPGRLRRRRLPQPLRRLDRAALQRGHHGRLRSRPVLPGQSGDARADVRLPAEDRARSGYTSRPRARRPSTTCRARASSPTGSSSSSTRASRADAAATTTAPTTPAPAARWPCSSTRSWACPGRRLPPSHRRRPL